MKKCSIIILLLLIVSEFTIEAQISHGGKPLSFSKSLQKKVEIYELPSFDYTKMVKEDMQKTMQKRYRYGKTHVVEISPKNAGSWQILDDGSRIWQLKLKSEKAFSLSIICDKYILNKNVQLYIYSPNKTQLLGSFTHDNNIESGAFATVPIAGSEMIIEIDVAPNTEYGEFHISGVVHDYKNIFKNYGLSGTCNINVNCPEGAEWQNEKKAVVKYFFDGYLCSGALINNTDQNGTPYVLTANHCISNQSEASTAVFWFNYESPGCEATGDPLHQSISSSSLISTGQNLDFTLLEMSSKPPSNYNVYYAGWNRGTTPPINSACIHHPNGDIKKISIDNDAAAIGNYGGVSYISNSHWNILDWESGTTEGGSSGSPLFDQNHRIIGSLTGGTASCGNSIDDYFARLDLDWDYHAEANRQLKAWLDPINTGAIAIDGYDPEAITTGLDAKLTTILSPTLSFCGVSEIAPQFEITNNGTGVLNSLTVNYKIDDGAIVSRQWNGNLQTSQKDTFTFDAIQFPFGSFHFKAFISSPNGGNDLKHSNDTIKHIYTSYDSIPVHQINGGALVCKNQLTSNFSAQASGINIWSVTGGKIINGQSTDNVSVKWNEWGVKKIDLNINHLCNSVDAPSLYISVVEHGISLTIQTGNNASSICWNIKDTNGNVLYENCDLPSNTTITESIILAQGYYELNIITGNSSIESLSVSDFCGNNNLVSGSNITGNYIKQFKINESGYDSEFNIFPNPAFKEFTIEASFSELYNDAQFSISNLRGEIVVPRSDLHQRIQININSLPVGVYIVKVYSSRGEFSRELIKY